MKNIILPLVFLFFTGINSTDHQAQSNVSYTVNDGAITGNNTGRYNNRPLYINNTNAFILTGDQPIARLAKDQFYPGSCFFAESKVRKKVNDQFQS